MAAIFYGQQQQRVDTSLGWANGNPVLLEGQIGVEGDTGKFKFGNGVSAWNDLPYAGGGGATRQTVSHTTASLAASATEDFTLSATAVFQLLSFTASTPAWVRIYGTAAARTADTRTSPGGTLPPAGSEYYAELVTTSASQTIRLSPVPLVQPTSGGVFVRVQNRDTVTRALALGFDVLSFGS